MNKTYITEAFCINKDKPELLCSGKCYLSDQLDNLDTQKEKIPTKNLEKKNINYFLTAVDLPTLLTKPIVRKKDILHYNTLMDNLYLKDIFHPPQLFID